MKRKFSFNMPPIKMSAREAAEGPQPSPAHSASSSRSHNREESKDSICDSSPYISRPILDLQTEAELRAACRLILQNFKPSDHGMENTDPKLDFNMNRRREQKPSVDVKVSVRVPTGAPVLVEGTQSHSNPFLGRKSSTKTRTRAKADMEIRARTQNEGPARANSSRKRADFGWLDDRDDKREQNLRKYGRSSMDQARPTNGKVDDDEVVTPVTVASSYAYSKNASTAPTSASVISGQSSNRRSRQIEGEDKNDPSQPQGRPTTAVRPPSRTASLRNGLRRTLSRSASKDSLRKTNTNDSQDAESQGSGWKGWGPIRRSLSRGSSRPGTSKGQTEDAEKKSEKVVNLNRELPPLPGLDTWKETEQPKKEEEKAKSPTSPVHIASLMKPQEPPQQDRVTAVRNPAHRRSGSDTLAVQYAQAFPVRTTSKLPLQIPPHPSRVAPNAPVNPDSPVAVSTGWSSTSNLNRGEVGSSTHTRQRSGDTQPTSSDAKMSMDVPNFSRNFSMDAPPGSYSTEVKIDKKEKDEQKSRLRKVFSGWMTRKQRKDQWMREIEKEGSIKDGVLVQDQSAGAPVVRY